MEPLTRATVPTDVQVQYPPNCYGEIVARSGLASKYGITVLAGLCDSDYTGCLFVILYNSSANSSYQILHGARIAQLVIRPKHENDSFGVCSSCFPIDVGKNKNRKITKQRGKQGLGSTGQ